MSSRSKMKNFSCLSLHHQARPPSMMPGDGIHVWEWLRFLCDSYSISFRSKLTAHIIFRMSSWQLFCDRKISNSWLIATRISSIKSASRSKMLPWKYIPGVCQGKEHESYLESIFQRNYSDRMSSSRSYFDLWQKHTTGSCGRRHLQTCYTFLCMLSLLS